jgi:hypothetical protein
LPSPRTGLGSRRAMLGHAPPTTPVLAPLHRWRSSSGRAYRVDYCRRHHCCRLPARGRGLAEPCWAMLRRLPPSSPRCTAGARPRAAPFASTTVAVTTVVVSPRGVGVSPSQAGPARPLSPSPRTRLRAAPCWAGIRRQPPPLYRSTVGARPRAGLLKSTAVAVSPHVVTVAAQLRHAGQGPADNPRSCTAALLALALGPGCSSRLLSPSPCTWLRASCAMPRHAPPTTPPSYRSTVGARPRAGLLASTNIATSSAAARSHRGSRAQHRRRGTGSATADAPYCFVPSVRLRRTRPPPPTRGPAGPALRSAPGSAGGRVAGGGGRGRSPRTGASSSPPRCCRVALLTPTASSGSGTPLVPWRGQTRTVWRSSLSSSATSATCSRARPCRGSPAARVHRHAGPAPRVAAPPTHSTATASARPCRPSTAVRTQGRWRSGRRGGSGPATIEAPYCFVPPVRIWVGLLGPARGRPVFAPRARGAAAGDLPGPRPAPRRFAARAPRARSGSPARRPARLRSAP